MSEPCFLSRATVRGTVPPEALRELVPPSDEDRRMAVGHRLVWTLFGDHPDRRRDFLWRENGDGVYYLLSRRPPEDRHGLFHLDPPKAFAPVLREGDRLHFELRANATRARSAGPGQRGKPCDVVMDALRSVPPGERATARERAIAEAGGEWMVRQGQRAGVTVDPSSLQVTAYRVVRVEHAGPVARFGLLDFTGVLTVDEPATFLNTIAHGFGRAKAFGCGLMLIRRAS